MLNIRTKRIRDVMVPHKLIFKRRVHEILNLDRKFVIKDVEVKTVDGKIDTITLKNPHPNANPRSGEFCIPHSLRQLELNENTLKMIKSMLCCFNLDDCYFTPWDEIEYTEQEVAGAWQSKTIK